MNILKLYKWQFIALVSAIFWALSLTINMYLLTLMGYSPIMVAVFTDLFSVLILIILFIFKYKKLPFYILKNIKGYTVIIGAILAGPIGMVCNNYAIKSMGASLTASITAIYPVIAIVLSVLFLHQIVNFKVYFGVILIVISVIIQNYSFTASSINIYGIIFASIAAFSWGSESVLSSYAMKNNLTEAETLFLRQFTSVIAYTCIFLPLVGKDLIKDINFNIIIFMLLMAILNILSYYCYYLAINNTVVAIATGLNSSYIVLVPFFSYFLLGLSISIKTILLSIFIFIGVFLIVRSDFK